MNTSLKKIFKNIDRSYGRFSVVRHGFWFVDIPRTSSSSIRIELGNRFGRAYGKRNVIGSQHSSSQIFSDHIPAREMRAFFGSSKWNRIFTFTIVRNPWDRTCSMYHYRHKVNSIPKEWSFRDYVLKLAKADYKSKFFEYYGFRFGADEYILGENGKIIVDFIAKYENRANDIQLIASRLKLDDLGKIRFQSAKPRETHYSEYYDQETREIIRRLYSKDIELFGYEFHSQP